MDEIIVLYNITNIGLSANSFQPTDLEVKFDDKQ